MQHTSIIISRPLFAALTLFAAVVSPLLATSARAAEGFALEKNPRGVAVTFNGKPVAEYVVTEANKPFLWPVFGPTGKAMTRAYPMKMVDGEQHDHPHHRAIYFGSEGINDFDTWHERATFEEKGVKPDYAKLRLARLGATKHREFRELKADATQAVIVTTDDYLGADGKVAFTDERRIRFQMNGESTVIDFDIEFIASAGAVKFGDVKDAGFSIRVPTSMAVDSKRGGRIITSEGITDAKAWGTRARWVDYQGPVEGQTLGIAMLNHPSSFRHPTPWHVRTYGLFTANPFGTHSLDKTAPDGAHTLAAGERLALRHRIILHSGDEKSARLAEAYDAYAREKK